MRKLKTNGRLVNLNHPYPNIALSLNGQNTLSEWQMSKWTKSRRSSHMLLIRNTVQQERHKHVKGLKQIHHAHSRES